MNCETAQKDLSLFLDGELPVEEEGILREHLESCESCRRELEREEAAHRVAQSVEIALPPELLSQCRRDLSPRIAREAGVPLGRENLRRWFSFRLPRFGAFARPAGAVALIAAGFFAARLTAPLASPLPPAQPAVDEGAVSTRIRYIEAEPGGKVQVVVDETRQRVLVGRPDDLPVRNLLLAAAKDSADPGLQVDSLDILKNNCGSEEVRSALISALEQDANPGARLIALDGLKQFAGDPAVRAALAHALLTDDNPGVRGQAIDVLIEKQQRDTISVLQQLVQRENNDSIRLRCQNALRAMNASVGTF